jgi:hypothetical protein
LRYGRFQKNGGSITQFDIKEPFWKACLEIQAGAIAIRGFKVTGLYPVNLHVFEDIYIIATEK